MTLLNSFYLLIIFLIFCAFLQSHSLTEGKSHKLLSFDPVIEIWELQAKLSVEPASEIIDICTNKQTNQLVYK